MENLTLVIIVQAVIVITLVVLVFQIVKLKNAIDLEKRILRFSIFSITEKPVSFFDKLGSYYGKLIRIISKFIGKSKAIVNFSNRYKKYLDSTKVIRENTLDILSNKILISLLALIITVISDVLRRQDISILQILLSLLVGFFIPDVFLYLNYKRKQKRIEEDLLKAVIIMSNAFKSGRSIMQAVEVVSKELDGPISEEFRKMYIDLTYGLELEIAFERLANRIKLEETKYLASSLVILNKTGGNVVKVFSSIERSFFERKKLEDELKSVTALSNFVFKILVAIPLVIFVMIYIFNPAYFVPFVTTNIGKVILVLILLIYTIYIIIVRKVIRIRE